MKIKPSRQVCRVLPMTLLLLAGCKEAAQVGVPKPPEVGVVTLKAQSVLLSSELPGRTSALRVAEVRPQVSGIIQKRLFNEGAMVKKDNSCTRSTPRVIRRSTTKPRLI